MLEKIESRSFRFKKGCDLASDGQKRFAGFDPISFNNVLLNLQIFIYLAENKAGRSQAGMRTSACRLNHPDSAQRGGMR